MWVPSRRTDGAVPELRCQIGWRRRDRTHLGVKGETAEGVVAARPALGCVLCPEFCRVSSPTSSFPRAANGARPLLSPPARARPSHFSQHPMCFVDPGQKDPGDAQPFTTLIVEFFPPHHPEFLSTHSLIHNEIQSLHQLNITVCLP